MRRPSSRKSAADARIDAANDLEQGSDDFDEMVADVLRVEDGGVVAGFPDHGLHNPFPLSFLNETMDTDCARAFQEGFAVWAGQRGTIASRLTAYRVFRYGFGAFLSARKAPQLTLSHLATPLVREFEAWLHKRFPKSQDEITKRMRALENIVERLWLMPQWADRVDRAIEFPPKRRRAIQTGTKTKKEVLAPPEYDALWLAASRKCKRLVRMHELRQAEISRHLGRSLSIQEAAQDPHALAAYMIAAYPKTIPPPYFEVADASVRKAVTVQTWRRARRMLIPSIEELLPSIVILSVVFGLNPSVVKNLRHRSDYRVGTSMGRKRLFMYPVKRRPSFKLQRNSVVATEDLDNPARVIRYLEERTAFTRARIGAPHSRLLFLYMMWGGVNSFAKTDAALLRAVAQFGRTHRIAGLQLRKLRSSTIDRLHQITGGDLLKVKSFANHSSIQTTFQDYTSDGIAQRDVEALGAAMLQHDRFIASNGVIRPFLLSADLDKGSATPGYACLDPLHSAIPGEEDGVLCKAYGRCPICPLSALQRTPKAYAYLQALATRVDEAFTQEVVSGPEWLGRWSIVKKSIARQMRTFPDELVLASADETITELPPLE